MQWSHYTSPQSGLTFTHAHSKVPVEWQPWTGPHIRLCNFVRNISTNISALGEHTHLKLGELSSLFIVYNMTIVWLHPLHSFSFFFNCVTVHTLSTSAGFPSCISLAQLWKANMAAMAARLLEQRVGNKLQFLRGTRRVTRRRLCAPTKKNKKLTKLEFR